MVGGLAVLVFVLIITTAAFGDGVAGASTWGLVVCSSLLLVSAVSALVRPRRWREPEVAMDDTRVFAAPPLTVWPLVGAWIALLVTASVWGWLAVIDFGALESPGFSLVTIAGALASLPTLRGCSRDDCTAGPSRSVPSS